MKISQGSTNKLIAFLFDVDESKVTKKLSIDRYNVLVFQPLVMWSDKEMLVANMPSCFKPRCAKVMCNRLNRSGNPAAYFFNSQ